MSCGNSKQQIERAGVTALQICQAPYLNASGEILTCNCPYSAHRDETVPSLGYFFDLISLSVLMHSLS